jgi:hypothetical protein
MSGYWMKKNGHAIQALQEGLLRDVEQVSFYSDAGQCQLKAKSNHRMLEQQVTNSSETSQGTSRCEQTASQGAIEALHDSNALSRQDNEEEYSHSTNCGCPVGSQHLLRSCIGQDRRKPRHQYEDIQYSDSDRPVNYQHSLTSYRELYNSLPISNPEEMWPEIPSFGNFAAQGSAPFFSALPVAVSAHQRVNTESFGEVNSEPATSRPSSEPWQPAPGEPTLKLTAEQILALPGTVSVDVWLSKVLAGREPEKLQAQLIDTLCPGALRHGKCGMVDCKHLLHMCNVGCSFCVILGLSKLRTVSVAPKAVPLPASQSTENHLIFQAARRWCGKSVMFRQLVVAS